jgi:hypothetical protein
MGYVTPRPSDLSAGQLYLLTKELSNKQGEANKSRPSSRLTPPFEPHVRASIPDGTRSLDFTISVVEKMHDTLNEKYVQLIDDVESLHSLFLLSPFFFSYRRPATSDPGHLLIPIVTSLSRM